MDRIDKGVLRDARGANRIGVRVPELVGAERQLFEEPERRAQLLVDRRGTPVALDRLPDLVPERIRRDRGVGVRSEGA